MREKGERRRRVSFSTSISHEEVVERGRRERGKEEKGFVAFGFVGGRRRMIDSHLFVDQKQD